MGMQIRCRCGANLVVAVNTPSVVCASCQTTIAVPQPDVSPSASTFGTAETALAMPMTASTTTPPKRSAAPLAIAAVLVVATGGAITFFALQSDPTPVKHEVVVPTPASDAAPPVPSIATSPEELVVLERAAVARADEAALLPLLAANAFAHGIDAGEIAYTGPAAAAMLRTMIAKPATVTSTSSKIVRDRDVAWIVDELDVGDRHFMTSQLAYLDAGVWRVAAWHWARLVPNPKAYELAVAGRLPMPAAITDQFDDDHQVADAMRAAFASREAFADAFSERSDAIDLGSAPREQVTGGAAIKRTFRDKIAATFAIHDGVAAGRVSDRVGWGAANIDFTQKVKGADTTQTFRVLAILVRERAGWRLVLAQWSNAGPLP